MLSPPVKKFIELFDHRRLRRSSPVIRPTTAISRLAKAHSGLIVDYIIVSYGLMHHRPILGMVRWPEAVDHFWETGRWRW